MGFPSTFPGFHHSEAQTKMLALIEFAEILRYGGRENYAAITEASGGDYLTFRFSMPKLLRLHFAFARWTKIYPVWALANPALHKKGDAKVLIRMGPNSPSFRNSHGVVHLWQVLPIAKA